jgi:WXG100 family type VII secretion target
VSDRFRVDLAQLDQIAIRLAGLAGYMSDQFAELDRRVAALHDGSWSGQAASAHAEAHREWSAGAAEFHHGVADMQAAAKKAHAHYTSAINANRRTFGKR